MFFKCFIFFGIYLLIYTLTIDLVDLFIVNDLIHFIDYRLLVYLVKI